MRINIERGIAAAALFFLVFYLIFAFIPSTLCAKSHSDPPKADIGAGLSLSVPPDIDRGGYEFSASNTSVHKTDRGSFGCAFQSVYRTSFGGTYASNAEFAADTACIEAKTYVVLRC